MGGGGSFWNDFVHGFTDTINIIMKGIEIATPIVELLNPGVQTITPAAESQITHALELDKIMVTLLGAPYVVPAAPRSVAEVPKFLSDHQDLITAFKKMFVDEGLVAPALQLALEYGNPKSTPTTTTEYMDFSGKDIDTRSSARTPVDTTANDNTAKLTNNISRFYSQFTPMKYEAERKANNNKVSNSGLQDNVWNTTSLDLLKSKVDEVIALISPGHAVTPGGNVCTSSNRSWELIGTDRVNYAVAYAAVTHDVGNTSILETVTLGAPSSTSRTIGVYLAATQAGGLDIDTALTAGVASDGMAELTFTYKKADGTFDDLKNTSSIKGANYEWYVCAEVSVHKNVASKAIDGYAYAYVKSGAILDRARITLGDSTATDWKTYLTFDLSAYAASSAQIVVCFAFAAFEQSGAAGTDDTSWAVSVKSFKGKVKSSIFSYSDVEYSLDNYSTKTLTTASSTWMDWLGRLTNDLNADPNASLVGLWDTKNELATPWMNRVNNLLNSYAVSNSLDRDKKYAEISGVSTLTADKMFAIATWPLTTGPFADSSGNQLSRAKIISLIRVFFQELRAHEYIISTASGASVMQSENQVVNNY